ncbi:hypothetical protein, partial [Klebsiella pneumoniae]|uniref:hypothetical protein n=1 Tax=Klebsiella pneumoniae TaxID=573 RepID=UPI0027318F25
TNLSKSNKTTFYQTINKKSKKQLISLLPKTKYQYLFPNIIKTNFNTIKIKKIPLILFLKKSSISSNPHSTINTHTNIFTKIQKKLTKI